MSTIPTFTIVLPVTGRSNLVNDAFSSVIEQSFQNFEIIISNNGADPAVRKAVADKLSEPRVRYVEQLSVLPMPEHWERISLLGRGSFLIVLTDRSVLKQGALATLAELHSFKGPEADVVTWPWDLYHEDIGILLPYSGSAQYPKVVDSETLVLNSCRFGAGDSGYILPRGLNSSVSLKLVSKIRARTGVAFKAINPDYSFAYKCLMSHPKLTHANQALMVSQGLSLSNGGNSYLTDGSKYVAGLGLEEPVRYSPIKSLIVENLIAEDFFAACHDYGRGDLLEKAGRADLYLKCFQELDEKWHANRLSAGRLEELTQSVETALEKETSKVRSLVNSTRNRSFSLVSLSRRAKRNLLGTQVVNLKPLLLRFRGGKRFESALAASGHRSS